jgi:hypothetical protein
MKTANGGLDYRGMPLVNCFQYDAKEAYI